MHQYRIYFLLFIFFISLSKLSLSAIPNISEGDWELIIQNDGIEVFERWVETEEHIKVKERTGKMTLHCSEIEVINLIADATKTHLWMNNVESVKILSKTNCNEWYIRTVLDAPWPFGLQDMVSKYTIEKTANENKTIVYIDQANNIYPNQEGIDRLDSFVAKWEVTKTGKNTIKVSFTTCSTKPPEYPSWMQDPVVRKVFLSNLKNFKKVLGGNQFNQG